MPTSSPEQPARSTWRKVFDAVKKELPALAAGLAAGFIAGPIGFVAVYCAASGYTSTPDSGGSKFSKMVGLGVASTAATIGLAVVLGPVGLIIGATLTVAGASYINNGVVRVATSSVAEVVTRRFGRERQGPVASHVQAPPAPQRAHHEVVPKPSVLARAIAVGARARDIIRGRRPQTIDAPGARTQDISRAREE